MVGRSREFRGNRKGLSPLVLIMIILVTVMVAISWYQATITGGSNQGSQILDQRRVGNLDLQLQNMVQYLHESFGMDVMRASWYTANRSGRPEDEAKYRYWLCQEERKDDEAKLQIPPKKKVRKLVSNRSRALFEQRLDQISGNRDGYKHSAEGLSCVNVGYQVDSNASLGRGGTAGERSSITESVREAAQGGPGEIAQSPQHDDFLASFDIRDVSVEPQEGNLSRSREDRDMRERIRYNRMWYIYSVMSDWVEERPVKEMIKDQVKSVRDFGRDEEENTGPCGWFGGGFPDAALCRNKHPDWLEARISNGIADGLDKLEAGEEYFNQEGVSCRVRFNSKDGEDYPGYEIQIESQNIGKHDSFLTWKCITKWKLKFEIRLDYTLICEDERFESMPMDKLRTLKWKVDMSYKVKDEDVTGGKYEKSMCTQKSGPIDVDPEEYRECSVEETKPRDINICETDVNTIENFNPE